jgi:four helix bundle protein
MTPAKLKSRTKKFAIRVLRLADSLPRTPSGRTVANQIAASGTSAASNFRAACKARSRKEFIARIGVAQEEADETLFWLEIPMEAGMISTRRLQPPYQAACELTATMASSRKPASNSR